MNIIEIQDSLKDLPDSALMKEMQAPTGSAPQFLVLSELKRRKRMRDEFQRQQNMDMPTVAEEVVTAAGMPQEGIMGAARAMAPNTNVAQNTGMDMAASVPATRAPQPQMMADGGVLRYAPGGAISAQPTGEGGTYILMQDGEKIPGTGTYPDFRSANEAARAIRDVPAFQRSRVLSDLGQPEPILETEVSALSQVDPDAMAFAANDEMRRQLQLRQARGQRDDPSVGGIASLDPLGRAFMDEYRPDMSVASSQEGIPEFGDAPYAQTNLANLLETMTKANEGIAREGLPESADGDLRFSRGTASTDAVKDALTDYRRTTDEKGYPFDSTLRSADRLLDGELPYIKAPSLATDAPAPLSEVDLMRRVARTTGMVRPDVDFADPTMVPDPNFRVGETTQEAVDLTPTLLESLVSDRADVDPPLNVLGLGGQGDETKDSTVTRRTGRTDSSSDGSFSFSDLLPDMSKFGFGNAITDLYKEDATVTPNEASVVDTAATEDLVTEEAKVESGDKEVPTIRPKLRPADLLTPTGPSGPSGPSGLSGADLSIASMLEARKKEAEADKWMALAYAGMELMKPTATIGEGLGKAGQAGLGYLTKSKKGLQDFETDMLKLQTQRDIANIRAAASGKSSSSASLTTNRVILKELLATVDNELARIDLTGRGKIPPEKLDDYNRLIEERQDIIEEMRKLTTLGSSDNSGNSGLSGTFDVPPKP